MRRKKLMRTHALHFTLLLGYVGVTLAHGNVHERIHGLDHEIAHHPKDVVLLIKRGRLLLDEGHADDARDDFIKAYKLAPKRIDALYHLAQAQLMLKQPDAALESAKQFLQQATNDAARVRGLVLTGDILSASGKPLDAAEAYLKAVNLSQEINPDYVLYAANAFHAAGKTDKALEVLNDGIVRLGSLHTLNDRALELEMEQKLYEPALRRIDRMLATHQRVPFLLYKKGVILKALVRTSEAKQTLASALKEIEEMPESRKHTQAIEDLKNGLLAEINF
jgi:tetratricopeptide (TPR) repeat protein